MLLSILIPSLASRSNELINLKADLYRQIIACNAFDDIEIITEIDNGEMTIGEKRNLLLSKAKGIYLCFHDDDDMPASSYIQKILDCIKTKCDNCSMIGVITWDGQKPELFEHSIKYSEYKTNPDLMVARGTYDVHESNETINRWFEIKKKSYIKYERYPNHLNIIKSSIAKQFRFPATNHGEDTDFATQIFRSGLLKKETEIEGIIYYYNYKIKK